MTIQGGARPGDGSPNISGGTLRPPEYGDMLAAFRCAVHVRLPLPRVA